MCVWSLQAEALRVGDGDGEFVFELLPGSIRRQTDLIETGVRDRQPAETERQRDQLKLNKVNSNLNIDMSSNI